MVASRLGMQTVNRPLGGRLPVVNRWASFVGGTLTGSLKPKGFTTGVNRSATRFGGIPLG